MKAPKKLILNKEPQVLTSFPNQNNKHIDYVLTYKYSENVNDEDFKRNELVRKSFLDRLRNEEIEIDFIKFKKKNEYNVYILLHSPIKRLLLEAEKIKHEMRINPVC